MRAELKPAVGCCSGAEQGSGGLGEALVWQGWMGPSGSGRPLRLDGAGRLWRLASEELSLSSRRCEAALSYEGVVLAVFFCRRSELGEFTTW